MPVEQLCLTLTAMAMLFMAYAGTGMGADPAVPMSTMKSRPVVVPEKAIPRVDAEVVQIDFREFKIFVVVENERRTLQASKTVPVIKDKKQGGLELLARGDQARFFLSSSGSSDVTRIEVFTAH